jgi:hypothetical protein
MTPQFPIERVTPIRRRRAIPWLPIVVGVVLAAFVVWGVIWLANALVHHRPA